MTKRLERHLQVRITEPLDQRLELEAQKLGLRKPDFVRAVLAVAVVTNLTPAAQALQEQIRQFAGTGGG